MKKVVIIQGVTGAIGTALLAHFTREKDTVVYGLSRRALSFRRFKQGNVLPGKTLICSIGGTESGRSYHDFVTAAGLSRFEKVVYIHALGLYPFEISSHGKHFVANDLDGDGINDEVMDLTYTRFFTMVRAFKGAGCPTDALLFGGLADRHKPLVHHSWWSVIGMFKDEIHKKWSDIPHMRFFVLNISSVICPHELLTRPFVFQKTNADPRFWLAPHEVARGVAKLITSRTKKKFTKKDLFHRADYFEEHHFENTNFTKRKCAELGIKG